MSAASPPSCEVYANTDLAGTSEASVQPAVNVIRPVLAPGSTNALLILAIVASLLTLMFAAAPVGWGEYKEGASVSAAFEGNTSALQLLAAGHGATCFFTLVGLSIYQSHAASVDQVRAACSHRVCIERFAASSLPSTPAAAVCLHCPLLLCRRPFSASFTMA